MRPDYNERQLRIEKAAFDDAIQFLNERAAAYGYGSGVKDGTRYQGLYWMMRGRIETLRRELERTPQDRYGHRTIRPWRYDDEPRAGE
jgi:hypothetical protein